MLMYACLDDRHPSFHARHCVVECLCIQRLMRSIMPVCVVAACWTLHQPAHQRTSKVCAAACCCVLVCAGVVFPQLVRSCFSVRVALGNVLWTLHPLSPPPFACMYVVVSTMLSILCCRFCALCAAVCRVPCCVCVVCGPLAALCGRRHLPCLPAHARVAWCVCPGAGNGTGWVAVHAF